MGSATVTRDTPPLYRQPAGSAKCWAYAMSSWMKVSGRPATSPGDIMAACSAYADPRNGALFPSKFPEVAESKYIRMGWKVLTSGAQLDWSEVRDLLDVGWIYAIVDTPPTAAEQALGTHFSHARVVYAASSDNRWGGAVMSVIDPILGDYEWRKAEVDRQKLMLGFARDLLTSDEVPDRKSWLVKTDSGNPQYRWCPKG